MAASPRSPVAVQRPVVIGTRGSALAGVQTEEVVKALQARFPEREVRLRVVRTKGDINREAPLAGLGLGVFTRELESALLTREIDLAVHSLKDLATELPPGLSIIAVPQRLDPRDVLFSRDGHRLIELPSGARMGTSSPRRAALVKALRPDLEVLSIRGNVETRLKKVSDGQYDAAVLAAAGMLRLGLEKQIVEYFDPSQFIPAVGQGALAVEARDDDGEIAKLVASLNHQASWDAVTAERAFLRALGGGCRVPMAAYGEVKEQTLRLSGLVIAEDGSQVFQAQVETSVEEPEKAGQQLAQEVLAQGAGELLQTEEQK